MSTSTHKKGFYHSSRETCANTDSVFLLESKISSRGNRRKRQKTLFFKHTTKQYLEKWNKTCKIVKHYQTKPKRVPRRASGLVVGFRGEVAWPWPLWRNIPKWKVFLWPGVIPALLRPVAGVKRLHDFGSGEESLIFLITAVDTLRLCVAWNARLERENETSILENVVPHLV